MKKITFVSAGLVAGLAMISQVSTAGAADITLKFGMFGSGKSPFNTRGTAPWRQNIGKLSGGKVEVKKFLNTLGGARELYKNTKDGIADIAWVIASAQRGFKFPRSEVMSLPNILDGYNNQQANIALWRLYEKGLVKSDYSDVVPMGFASMSPVHVVTKDKEPTLRQLKGMKLAATSSITAQVVKSLGGIPVFMPVTGLYQAMSRRTVEGMMIGLTAVKAFRLDEVSNRHTLVPLNSPLVFIGMNKKKLDGLPAGARKAVIDASGIHLSRGLGRAGDGMVGFTRKILSKNPNQKLISVPDARKAKWRAAVKPVVDRWVKSTPNGAAILAAYKKELEAAKRGR